MKETFISNAPLFSSLSLDEQSLIGGAMKAQTFANGERLLLQGQPVQQLYLIQAGWIKQTTALDGGRTLVNNLGPGSLVAEMDALLDQPATSSAEAHSDVSLWALSKTDLDEILAQHPLIALKFSTALGTRLQQVDRYLINQRLRAAPLFAELGDDELSAIAAKLSPLEVRRGGMIFRAGTASDALFLIEDGDVLLSTARIEGNDTRTLHAGELLGEMAVLTNKPYDGAARASSECVLWMLRREDFGALTEQYPKIRAALSARLSQPLGQTDRALARQQLAKLTLFADLPAEVVDGVASVIVLRHVPSGEKIFSAGDSGDSLIIVEQGEVQLVGDAKLMTLRAGDYYGEQSLLTGKTRTESALAASDCNLWILSRSDYDELLARFPALGTALSKAVSARLSDGSNSAFLHQQLKHMPLFANLGEAELQEIACALYAQTYRRGEVIFAEGQRADAAFLIESGEVQLATRVGDSYQMHFERMGAGDFFGEIALLAEGARKSTARSIGDETQVWVLYKSDFDRILAKFPQLASQLSKVMSERLARADERPAPRRQVTPPSNGARPIAPRPVSVRASTTPAVKRPSAQPNSARPTPLTLKPTSEPKPARPVAGQRQTTAVSARPLAGGVPQAMPVPARPQPRSMSERAVTPLLVAGSSAARAVAPRAAASRTAVVTASSHQAQSSPVTLAVYNSMNWMKARSLGFKFRMVAVTMLFVWLCGITAPVAVLSALNSPQSANALSVGGLAVVLGDGSSANQANALATFTATPPAASGQQRNAPPVSATKAVAQVAGKTPTKVAARPTQGSPTNSAQTLNPVPADVQQPTSTPSVDYKLVKVRQLTPCENNGNHHIFALVLDKDGKGIPNVDVEFIWDSGSFKDRTGQKVEYIPALGITNQTTTGYVNWPIYKGRTRVRVSNSASDMTDWLRVDLPDQRCDANDNPIGNSLFHYSYLVVFQKVR